MCRIIGIKLWRKFDFDCFDRIVHVYTLECFHSTFISNYVITASRLPFKLVSDFNFDETLR